MKLNLSANQLNKLFVKAYAHFAKTFLSKLGTISLSSVLLKLKTFYTGIQSGLYLNLLKSLSTATMMAFMGKIMRSYGIKPSTLMFMLRAFLMIYMLANFVDAAAVVFRGRRAFQTKDTANKTSGGGGTKDGEQLPDQNSTKYVIVKEPIVEPVVRKNIHVQDALQHQLFFELLQVGKVAKNAYNIIKDGDHNLLDLGLYLKALSAIKKNILDFLKDTLKELLKKCSKLLKSCAGNIRKAAKIIVKTLNAMLPLLDKIANRSDKKTKALLKKFIKICKKVLGKGKTSTKKDKDTKKSKIDKDDLKKVDPEYEERKPEGSAEVQALKELHRELQRNNLLPGYDDFSKTANKEFTDLLTRLGFDQGFFKDLTSIANHGSLAKDQLPTGSTKLSPKND